jgi:hypothetical protein
VRLADGEGRDPSVSEALERRPSRRPAGMAKSTRAANATTSVQETTPGQASSSANLFLYQFCVRFSVYLFGPV